MEIKQGLTYHGNGPDRVVVTVGNTKVLFREIYRHPGTKGPYRMKSKSEFREWAQGIVVVEETENA